MKSHRERQETSRLRDLDQSYSQGTVCAAGFYKALEDFGIYPDSSVLLEISPDSGSTVVGRLLDESGGIWEFDIDYDVLEQSTIENSPQDNRDRLKVGDHLKIELARILLAEKLA